MPASSREVATRLTAQLRSAGQLCAAETMWGHPCRGYANGSGLCPTHDGRTPRGVSPVKETLRKRRRAEECRAQVHAARRSTS